MNILVQLAHPAQFYFYKNSINEWIKHGNKVAIVIKTKDILEQLLINSGLNYFNINDKQHRGSKLGMLYDMLLRDFRLIKICRKEKIDLLTGSTAEVAQVAWLLRKYSVCIGEDDASIVPIYVKSVLPFLQTRLTPNSCRCGKMEPKSVHYSGFQKLAYLHPNIFTPSIDIVRKYNIDTDKPYFIIRLVSLTAYHDEGINGMNKTVVQKVINLFQQYGSIYVSSERELEPEFEAYRLNINPLDIHHLLFYSSFYLGDSQSMAVESAMLGVPNIRFNDFAGKRNIGVLEELENNYGLTISFSSSEPQKLFEKLEEMLAIPELRKEFQSRRQKMLADKIDVSAFLTWFIENYPDSKKEMREKPDIQYNFK